MNTLQYERLASVEDRMWYFRALHSNLMLFIEQRLGRTSEIRLLDAGCGTGGFLRRVRQRRPAWSTEGVDHSEEACARAAELGTDRVRVASVEQLPFEDQSFDVVVSADVFYQVEKPEAALREIRRVLRPGGVAVITAPAYQWLWSYHDEAVGGKRRFSRSGLKALFAAQDLDSIRVSYWNSLTFPAAVAKRKLSPKPDEAGDVELGPAWVEAILGGVMAAERSLLSAGLNWPWGANLIASGVRLN